jgi:hypothetical protein
MKCCDKKIVTMVSTYHGDERRVVTVRGKEMQKPVSVIEYSKYMGPIDLKAKMLQMSRIQVLRLSCNVLSQSKFTRSTT